MRQQRSLIWNFYDLFYEGDKKFGSCKTCKASVVCSSGSTTGLQFHLKHKHVEQFRQFQEDKLTEFQVDKYAEFYPEKVTKANEDDVQGIDESDQIEETFSETNLNESVDSFSEKILLS